MKFQDTLGLIIEGWINMEKTRMAANAKRAAELTSSDWSVIDGLAEYYATREVVYMIEANVAHHAKGLVTFSEMLDEISKESLRTLLMMARRGSSTSGGSNLIDAARRAKWAEIVELSGSWVEASLRD